MQRDIAVYGADWCGDTRRALKHLDSKGVEYRYIDIEDDAEGEKKVIAWNQGKRRVPTIEITSDDGSKVLSVPTASELDSILGA